MTTSRTAVILTFLQVATATAASSTLLWSQQKRGGFGSAAIALHNSTQPTFVVTFGASVEVYNSSSLNGTKAWAGTYGNGALIVKMALHPVGLVDTIAHGSWGDVASTPVGCVLLAWSSLDSSAIPAWVVNDTWNETGGCTSCGAELSDDGSTVAFAYMLGYAYSDYTAVFRVFDAQTGVERWRHTAPGFHTGPGFSVSASGVYVTMFLQNFTSQACETAVYEVATGVQRGSPVPTWCVMLM